MCSRKLWINQSFLGYSEILITSQEISLEFAGHYANIWL